MALTISKVNLPEEVIIEEEGAKFTFSQPLATDYLSPGLLGSGVGAYVWYAVNKIKKIEGFFYDDGSPFETKDMDKLPGAFLIKLGAHYAEKYEGYFGREVELKKELVKSESTDS
jgi:hypothetical protein